MGERTRFIKIVHYYTLWCSDQAGHNDPLKNIFFLFKKKKTKNLPLNGKEIRTGPLEFIKKERERTFYFVSLFGERSDAELTNSKVRSCPVSLSPPSNSQIKLIKISLWRKKENIWKRENRIHDETGQGLRLVQQTGHAPRPIDAGARTEINDWTNFGNKVFILYTPTQFDCFI